MTAPRAFEDILDGYFPLRESLRQMMDRRGAGCAVILVIHAPAVAVPGLAPDAPVPLSITQEHGAMIQHMGLVVQMRGGQAHVGGAGRWHWAGPDPAPGRGFSDLNRLAEPAFVRGVEWADAKAPVLPQGLDLNGEIRAGDGADLRDFVAAMVGAHAPHPDPVQWRILQKIVQEWPVSERDR